MTQNLGDVIEPRPSVAEIVEVLSEMPRADVYLLQEVAGRRTGDAIAAALAENRDENRDEYAAIYTGRAGVAIITRLPVVEWSIPPSDSAVQATLSTGDGGTVRVVSLHLPAFGKPRQRDGDARIGPVYALLRVAREAVTPNGRSRSLDRILDWLGDEAGEEAELPTVVGGDFNTVPLTLAPRKMRKQFRDSLKGSGDFWTGTYRRIAGPLSARVDFLFHTKALGVVDAFVHRRSAGDHFPVYAEYDLTSG